MSINNLFWQFQKINYALPDSSSQSSNTLQGIDINQGEGASELIHVLETEIANLQKTQDLLFFGKFLLTCATVVTPLIMGLIYYFNANSVITVPIISGVGGGCLGSLGLLSVFDKYNSNKIAKKNQQKSILGQNIFDPERVLFQEDVGSATYLVDDSEDLQISTSRSSFDQTQPLSVRDDDVGNNQDEKTSEKSPSLEFNHTSNPARFEVASVNRVDVLEREKPRSQSSNQSNAPRDVLPSREVSEFTIARPLALETIDTLTT